MSNPERHLRHVAANLGKRERQIMDIVYRRGRASVQDVLADLPDPPTYSSVRAMLRYLEDKDQLRHEVDGPRYLYFPTATREAVRGSALGHVVRTFFEGSATSTVAALLESGPISRAEHERLTRLLDSAVEEES